MPRARTQREYSEVSSYSSKHIYSWPLVQLVSFSSVRMANRTRRLRAQVFEFGRVLPLTTGGASWSISMFCEV